MNDAAFLQILGAAMTLGGFFILVQLRVERRRAIERRRAAELRRQQAARARQECMLGRDVFGRSR